MKLLHSQAALPRRLLKLAVSVKGKKKKAFVCQGNQKVGHDLGGFVLSKCSEAYILLYVTLAGKEPSGMV